MTQTEVYSLEFNAGDLHFVLENPDNADEFLGFMERNRDYLRGWTGGFYDSYDKEKSDKAARETVMHAQNGESFIFGAYKGDDDQLCAVVDIRGLGSEGAEPEVGYMVDETYRGQGIASRATLAMIDFVRASHPFDSVVLHTYPDNAASSRVAEKMGFAYVGMAMVGDKKEKKYRKELPARG